MASRVDLGLGQVDLGQVDEMMWKGKVCCF